MSPIGVQTPIGARVNWVHLEGPGGAPQPDGDGGYIVTPAALDPPDVFARIWTANQADMERVTNGTVTAGVTLLVALPFHLGVTTNTRLTWTDQAGRARSANVVSVFDVDERARELVVAVAEVKP